MIDGRLKNMMPAMSAEASDHPGLPDLANRHIVLFVDDEPEVLASVRRLLRKEPYELLTTERPSQALQWVREKAVSLIICDQVMPEKLGIDLLDEVRAQSPAIRCAVLTAYPEGAKLLRRRSQEDLHVIAKPWEDEDLRGCIRGILRDLEDRPEGKTPGGPAPKP